MNIEAFINRMIKQSFWIESNEFDQKEFISYKRMLSKIKNKDCLSKINILLENPRLKKNNKFWALKFDKAEIEPIDFNELIKSIAMILKRDFPVAKFLKLLLDYGVSYSHIQLEKALTNNQIRMRVLRQTEEQTLNDVKSMYLETNDLIKTIFKKEPTTDQLRNLKKNDTETFKKYQKIKRQQNQTFKDLRTKIFEEKNSAIIDIEEFNNELNELGIKSKIDKKFKGKIDSYGNYRTITGKKLIVPLGSNVKMNKKYNPSSDDTYYCISLNVNGTKVAHYTDEYFEKRRKEKYAKNIEFGEQLNDIRSAVSDDLNGTNKRYQIYALIVSLIDQAYFRIGSKSSEGEGHYGLTTLRVKHVSFNENAKRIDFNYVGKDGVLQNKIITDTKIFNLMKELVDGKGPDEYIFTDQPKRKMNKPKIINKGDISWYMRERLNAPVSIHKFRTYHATRLAQEELEKAKIKNPTKESIMETFKTTMDKIATRFGHTSSNTTVKHYIDTSVLQSFFNKYNIKPPKVIKSLEINALKYFLHKFAKENIQKVKSDFSLITPEEEKFNEWMVSLPEEVIDKTAITVL